MSKIGAGLCIATPHLAAETPYLSIKSQQHSNLHRNHLAGTGRIAIEIVIAIMSSTMTTTQTSTITAENILRLFPQVNTTLIGAARDTTSVDNDLEGYDEEQIRLMDEVCIVLDENDVPIGSASKKICGYII